MRLQWQEPPQRASSCVCCSDRSPPKGQQLCDAVTGAPQRPNNCVMWTVTLSLHRGPAITNTPPSSPFTVYMVNKPFITKEAIHPPSQIRLSLHRSHGRPFITKEPSHYWHYDQLSCSTIKQTWVGGLELRLLKQTAEALPSQLGGHWWRGN